MAVSPPRPPGARPPSPSITREVSSSEMAALAQGTRPADEAVTKLVDGASMNAILSSERGATPGAAPEGQPDAARPPMQSSPNVIKTNTRSAQVSGMISSADRANVVAPVTAGPAVVVAPAVLASASAPAPSAAPPQANEAPPPVVPASMRTPNAGPASTATPPSKSGLVFVIGGAALLAGALGMVLFLAKDDEATKSPEAAASAAEAASATASSSESAAPKAPPANHEAEARDALTRLRDGIGQCVRGVIRTLPGTAPAIPPSFELLAGPGYTSNPRDFRSPVYACAKYTETGSMHFQIQWQLVQHPSEGRGVVWIDDDGDGKPDRALGFRAALVQRSQVELGEIGVLDPIPPVMKSR